MHRIAQTLLRAQQNRTTDFRIRPDKTMMLCDNSCKLAVTIESPKESSKIVKFCHQETIPISEG